LVLLHDETERVKADAETRERIRLETELTERKRSEQKLRASEAKFRNLVENAAAGILVNTPEGQVLGANRAGLEILGFDSEEEIQKTSIEERYVNIGDRKTLLGLLERYGVAKGFEVMVKRKDGTPFWASLNVITQVAESGGTQLLSIIEDITERKGIEQEIIQKTWDLQMANKVKSDFLSSMSHELRTPLNAVIGFSQLLRDGLPGQINDEQKDFLDEILIASHHLLSVVNDILDLSRIEARTLELRLEEINLGDVIEDATRTIKHMLAEKQHCLEVRLENGLPMVHADNQRLKQVMINLLGNGIRYTHLGGKLAVNAARDGDYCVVSVTDNGIGIKEEKQAKLFDIHLHSQLLPDDRVEGAGLGLAIAKRFVDAMGGRIWAESEYGRGSKFSFTLPLVNGAIHAEKYTGRNQGGS